MDLNKSIDEFDFDHIATKEEFIASSLRIVELSEIDISSLEDMDRWNHLVESGSCLININSFLYRFTYEECSIFAEWIRTFLELRSQLINSIIKEEERKKLIDKLEKLYNEMPSLPKQMDQDSN